jgi:hypothetical protein
VLPLVAHRHCPDVNPLLSRAGPRDIHQRPAPRFLSRVSAAEPPQAELRGCARATPPGRSLPDGTRMATAGHARGWCCVYVVIVRESL